MNLTTVLRKEIKTAKQERSERASVDPTEQSAKGKELEDKLANLESELLVLIGNLEEQMAAESQGVIEPSSSRGGTQSSLLYQLLGTTIIGYNP
ncbi:hypothetical protein [Candidatus Ichthyocystis hellenicum]|uniref:hypothetical protein n=1 Tax=Candidatus Ichthyocystis hellenicum TaxID=1561003 RepID=UPI000B831243|nr:hypothetical protein [Candidatus Ichthyocystis hellenicum]